MEVIGTFRVLSNDPPNMPVARKPSTCLELVSTFYLKCLYHIAKNS